MKMLNLLLCISVFFAGCAGREANPIPVYLPGDENRSCEGLKAEIAQLQADMARLIPHSEKIEFDAMRQRHNRLLVYAAEKNCDMVGIRAERIPSIEERKQIEEELKKQEPEDK